MVAAAGVEDYTFFWWDLRPHPQLGTLEVRAMDAQARLGSVCGLAALVHGLVLGVRARADRPTSRSPARCSSSPRFRAGRDGLDATVWHDGALRPVRERIAAAVELARRYTPRRGRRSRRSTASSRDGNGADRMRAAHAEGGMPRVLHRLIDGVRGAPGSAGERCMTAAATATAAPEVAEHDRDRPRHREALGGGERDPVVDRVQRDARQQRARAPVEDAQQHRRG